MLDLFSGTNKTEKYGMVFESNQSLWGFRHASIEIVLPRIIYVYDPSERTQTVSCTSGGIWEAPGRHLEASGEAWATMVVPMGVSEARKLSKSVLKNRA